MDKAEKNLELVKRLLAAIEEGIVGEGLKEFYDDNVIQEEFPNRLSPNGATRDLQGILEASERGQKVLTKQRYQIRNILANESQVAFEALWTGTLAVEIGSIPVGGEMEAYFAQFIEIRDGKIVAQRTYDCFKPW